MKKLLCFFLTFSIYCCSDKDDRIASIEELSRPNCGEITRLWSANVSEGNPCYNQTGLGAGDFTIQVTNQLTGNIKNFCVNQSEYVRYFIGDTYCDNTDLSGW